MTDESGALCPVDFRYGRPEVRALFSRERRLARALQVEAALARTEADLGLVPADAASAIESAAATGTVTLRRVDELERTLQHDVMAITRALAEASGPGGAWVHFGATSADITDTAVALELKEATSVLRGDLVELVGALLDLAEREKATPEVGRTHGQLAVPISFGYKVVVTAAEFARHLARLNELAPRLAVGKMAGAVGTGAGFGPDAAAIEAGVMTRLGVGADEAPTQIVGRDRLAEFTNLLALIASSAERWATEIRNLQRTELGEVAEAFDETSQVGSSTMAQKRNPRLSENVTSLARLVRAFALPPMENMVQWHERDLANSANERIVVPHAVVLTDDLLTKLTEVVRHLEVDRARMAANLALAGGSAMTENLLLGLTKAGVARSEAHEILRTVTRDLGSTPLVDRARATPAITSRLSDAQIVTFLDPATYVAAAARKTEAVIARIRPAVAK